MATETVEIREKQIVIERFSQQLIPDFLSLFEASYGKTISEEYVRKKYDTAELGGSFFGYLAYHNEKPIAYYGVLPVPFLLDGKQVTAVQSADTMTHPEYRRHGLFPLLAKKTYQLAKNEGASLVFGWPNENSYPTFKNKLGWIDLGKMQRFSFKVRTFPLAKIAFKIKPIKKLYQQFVKAVAHDYGMKFMPSQKTGNQVPWSKEYLSYKESLGAYPMNTDLHGNVVISVDFRLKIGGLTKDQIDSFQSVLKHVKRKCFILGITEIQFIVSPDSEVSKSLLEHGHEPTDDLPLMYWPFNDSVQIDKMELTGFDYDGF